MQRKFYSFCKSKKKKKIMLTIFCLFDFPLSICRSLVPLLPRIPFICAKQGWNTKLKIWPSNHKAAGKKSTKQTSLIAFFFHHQIIKKLVENIPIVDLGTIMAFIPNSKLLVFGTRASCWLLWREPAAYPKGGGIKCEQHQSSEAQENPWESLAFQHLRISTWYEGPGSFCPQKARGWLECSILLR